MEYLYRISNVEKLITFSNDDIVWLSAKKHHVMIKEFIDANDIITGISVFDECLENGINYCALIKDKKILAMGCVERYSDLIWEVADIKVHQAHRGNGYGKAITSFISNYILVNGRSVTGYTRENNLAMRKIFTNLGFELILVSKNLKNDYYSQF